MLRFKNRIPLIACALLLVATCVQAAPFAKTFRFKQPDGTRIDVWGEGDEFAAVFEHEGYTIVRDRVRKTYMYARLSADGTELIPTRLEVGKADPAAGGLPPHLRITPESRQAKSKARFAKWDAGMEVTQRWKQQKRQLQAFRQAADDGPVTLAPPSFTTTGIKVGLCLLIDFPDDVGTIPQADINDFCNGDNYNGYTNSGSVKQYFQDVSNNQLTYSNIVTVYIRMTRPKTYYDDTSKEEGSQGNLLIKDALDILKALPEYEAEILPTFDALSVDENNQVVACNAFFAGDDSGEWSRGLWPHSWGLYEVGAQELSPGGKKVFRYQITNIGDSLELGTFCHENGHMLCGYPDLYDYALDGTDTVGGTGNFCLMGYGGGGRSPVQVCAYLKYASGWATTTELAGGEYALAALTSASGTAGFNHFYRVAKPGTPTEYYLFENRQQEGRDANIPGSGIAVWHIDEQGERDDERREYNTAHENFECTLMQADNQWHLHRVRASGTGFNYGDENDLFYPGNSAVGYQNRFTDATSPSARWWDGTSTGLEVVDFSASGPVMTLIFQALPPTIMTSSPLPDGRVGSYYSVQLRAFGGALPYVWDVVPDTLPAGVVLSEDGLLSGLPSESYSSEFSVAVTGANGKASTNQFSLTILPGFELPYIETFEERVGALPDGWTQEFVSQQLAWTFVNGNAPEREPAAAYRGTNNACFKSTFFTNNLVTRLVSPCLALGPDIRAPQLTFWHYMMNRQNTLFQDGLRIYYKTAYSNSWQLLTSYTKAVDVWTHRVIALPNPSETYYLAFEGKAKYGYGVHIDDVEVFDAYVPLSITAPAALPDAVLNQPYSYAFAGAGGVEPYTYELTPDSVLPDGLTLTNGVISGTATTPGSTGFKLVLTDGLGATTTSEFTLTVEVPRVALFTEVFENSGSIPVKWTQEYLTNAVAWVCRSGGGNGDTFNYPTNAYQGLFNAVLWASAYTNHTTRLVSPAINLGAAPADPRLDFWHCMTALAGVQDELRVYYKNSASGAWTLLANYTNNVTAWTKRTLSLPNPSSTYSLAFEGNARFGHGVCLDDIRVTDRSSAPIIMTTSPLPEGTLGLAYGITLTAVGGVGPYTWDIVSGTLPAGLALTSEGVLSGTPEVTTDGVVTVGVRVTGSDGYSSTNPMTIKVSSVQRLPFSQNFDARTQLPLGWSQDYVSKTTEWKISNGSVIGGAPAAAHSGTQNVSLTVLNTSSVKTRLITPPLDMGDGMTNALLSFWLCMAKYQGQDELKVLYKTNFTDAVWTELAYFTNSFPSWTRIELSLPDPSPNYAIAFEGKAQYGYGVCLDDVMITGDYAATAYEQWITEAFGGVTDEAIVGLEADPDGDGVVNWIEYAMAMDPLNPDAEALPISSVTSGYLTLAYRENPAATDVLFEVEACTNLVDHAWSTNGVSEILRESTGTWYQVIWQHDVPVTDAPQRFLRLKLTLP